MKMKDLHRQKNEKISEMEEEEREKQASKNLFFLGK